MGSPDIQGIERAIQHIEDSGKINPSSLANLGSLYENKGRLQFGEGDRDVANLSFSKAVSLFTNAIEEHARLLSENDQDAERYVLAAVASKAHLGMILIRGLGIKADRQKGFAMLLKLYRRRLTAAVKHALYLIYWRVSKRVFRTS